MHEIRGKGSSISGAQPSTSGECSEKSAPEPYNNIAFAIAAAWTDPVPLPGADISHLCHVPSPVAKADPCLNVISVKIDTGRFTTKTT